MAERVLVVVRHAKSAWPDGVADVRRPLNERGRRDAPEAGRWLAANVAAIDLAVLSPAVRVRQTWELLSPQLPEAPPSEVADSVYGEGPAALLTLVRSLSAATVLLIGHNPDLEVLVASLTGQDVVFKTSTIAVLTGSGAWSDAGPGWASLRATHTPRG